MFGPIVFRCPPLTLELVHSSPLILLCVPQDARAASSQVLVVLPGGGQCSSVGECEERCGEDPARCTAPLQPSLEREGGVWARNPDVNPLAGHFKVLDPPPPL